MLSSTTSADEIVVDGDGDNNIAPSSSSTRIMPRDPPTSAEEEEDGRTATNNNNTNTHVNDATTATPTRQRDSNFSRLTDPTTNVSQRRHNYNQRRSPPQSLSQQPQSLQQAGVSMRNGSSKRGEHEQSQKIIKSSRPSSAKGVALGGGSLERFIGQQVGGGNGGSDGHRGSRGGDDGTYGADSDLTMPTALQQMIPRRNNKSFNNDYVDGDEDEEEDD